MSPEGCVVPQICAFVGQQGMTCAFFLQVLDSMSREKSGSNNDCSLDDHNQRRQQSHLKVKEVKTEVC